VVAVGEEEEVAVERDGDLNLAVFFSNVSLENVK